MEQLMCSRPSWSVSPTVDESPERRSERNLQAHLPLLQRAAPLPSICQSPRWRCVYGGTHLFFMMHERVGVVFSPVRPHWGTTHPMLKPSFSSFRTSEHLQVVTDGFIQVSQQTEDQSVQVKASSWTSLFLFSLQQITAPEGCGS